LKDLASTADGCVPDFRANRCPAAGPTVLKAARQAVFGIAWADPTDPLATARRCGGQESGRFVLPWTFPAPSGAL